MITSNGCVVNVATVPADAADRLCSSAELIVEFGGSKTAVPIVEISHYESLIRQ